MILLLLFISFLLIKFCEFRDDEIFRPVTEWNETVLMCKDYVESKVFDLDDREFIYSKNEFKL